MFKRLLCALLCALMLLNAGIACAATPKEIYPLDYDSLPEPREGQHHYLLACIDASDGSKGERLLANSSEFTNSLHSSISGSSE